MPVAILLILLVLIAMRLINAYNKLVQARNARENSFADIDVQLLQRHDLVPQLVETVKAYSGHEKELLLKITEARSGAVSATTIDDKIKAEQQLSRALHGLTVSAESYPDLKANQQYLELQASLNNLENKLAESRRNFNEATTTYNNVVDSFPSNLVAANFGFRRELLFELPKVDRAISEIMQVPKF